MKKPNRRKKLLTPTPQHLRVLSPLRNDVILGLNGNFPQNHHGNQYLKRIIDVSRERYFKEKSSIGKEGIAITVLQHLIELKPRGRILKKNQDSKHFVVQDESNSLEIIKQLFQKKSGERSANTNLNSPCKSAPPSPGRRTNLVQQSPDSRSNRRYSASDGPASRKQTHGRASITNSDMSQLLDLLIKSPGTGDDKVT